jgi:hypothetical protein
MIKFFRKIRQNLLMENKTGKYFKYAIGEIILVVIGILIALSINNWNEHRKTQINQEKYLLLLKEEALKNINAIENAKDNIKLTMEGQLGLLELIDGNQDTISENYLSKLLLKTVVFSTRFNYENSVLTELKTSGELKNIRNDSIRNNLMAIEPLVVHSKDQEEFIIEDFETVGQLINEKGNRRRILVDNDIMPDKARDSISNIPILRIKEFENHLISYVGSCYGIVNRHYPRLDSHLKTLVIMIDQELENIK